MNANGSGPQDTLPYDPVPMYGATTASGPVPHYRVVQCDGTPVNGTCPKCGTIITPAYASDEEIVNAREDERAYAIRATAGGQRGT